MPRNPLLRLFVICLVALAPGWALAQGLVFAVNEGVTYRVGNDEIRARYAAISADLSKLLGQPVRVEPVGDYPTLRKGLADRSYDLALVHPAHISIGAIKNSGYRLVAVTKGFQNYSARFLVSADSPRKSRADAVQYTYTRYQDAVPFMVEHTFTQTGATASGAVVRQWEAAGGKVLAASKPVPIKHVIAGPRLAEADVARVREYFVELDTTDAGRKKLEAIKVQGYAAFDTAALLALGQWLGL